MLHVTSAPMRILMTTDCVGGVWRYAMDTCSALARQGAEVGLACLGPSPSPGQLQEAREAGIELIYLDAELDWIASDSEAIHAGAIALDGLVRGWSPTVVHLNAPALAGFMEQSTPCVSTAHSCMATWWSAVRRSRFPDDRNWYLRVVKAGLSAADTVLVPTRAFGDALAATYGPQRDLRVVPNGCRPVVPETKGSFALAAGRWWDDGKNARTLDAAAALTSCPIYAAGPLIGPNGAAASFRVARWAGDLRYTDVRGWFARAPIFVSPALYEPFGLAVLEAASAGAALVLSDIPTFRELWDRVAIFVDPLQPDAIADAVEFLAENHGACDRLGRAAHERARGFTIDRQVAGLMAAYQSAVSTHSQAA